MAVLLIRHQMTSPIDLRSRAEGTYEANGEGLVSRILTAR